MLILIFHLKKIFLTLCSSLCILYLLSFAAKLLWSMRIVSSFLLSLNPCNLAVTSRNPKESLHLTKLHHHYSGLQEHTLISTLCIPLECISFTWLAGLHTLCQLSCCLLVLLISVFTGSSPSSMKIK